MTTMFGRWFALAALFSLLLAGCDSAPMSGGRIVKKPKAYGSVVSLSPSTTMFIADNGGSSFLSGRTESCDLPAFVSSLKVVVKGTKPDYEAIMALEPDLIVYDKALYSDDEIAKIKGLNVETMEYNPRSLEDYADFVYRCGSKLGIESQTADYVDRVLNAEIAARSYKTSNPKVAIVIGDPDTGYMIAGKGTFAAELIRVSGGNVVGPEGDRFEAVNFERLVEINPDIIYFGKNVDAIYGDKRLQSISAIKEERVLEMDERQLVRMSSRIDDTIARFSKDMRELTKNKRKVSQ